MQTFSGNPMSAPLATGEGVLTGSASLQGYEAPMTLPTMDKTNPGSSAALIQDSVENVANGIALQVRATSIEATENDAKKPG